MNKLSKSEYIDYCRNIHGNKYDYSKLDYQNIRSNVKVICKEHGEFLQNAKKHKEGQGCPSCYGDRNLTIEEYIKKYGREEWDYSLLPDVVKIKSIIPIINKNTNLQYLQWADHHKNGFMPTKIESRSLIKRLKQIHGDEYDYIIEKDQYNSTDKIKIINNLTGDYFYYRIDRHLIGMKPNKVTKNLFLIKSKKIHGNKYDYSLIDEIKNGSQKVEIICKDHGIFKQSVSNHMNMGDGCPKCVGVGKWNTNLVISEFSKIHSDLYDYSKVFFNGIDKKVEIICKKHGSFFKNIHKHLTGSCCPDCQYISKGELFIKNYLEEIGIKYIRQHSFETCRYINRLNFDFYLPEFNTCIEFDGIQHFKPIHFFGGDKGLEKNKERDKCKNDWCCENKVNLIRIKWNQINKIKSILEDKLIKK
jgi:very-short-patch-repair endonuclease